MAKLSGGASAFCLAMMIMIGLFLGLFFGLNYPEIKRAGYTSTQCLITDKNLDQRYCCKKVCSGCSESPYGLPRCSSVVNSVNRLYDPDVCIANNRSQDYCAKPSYPCQDGYECCSECCSTCTSCSTSCSKGSCSTSCSSYTCNCFCCSSVSERYCSVVCPTCYAVTLYLQFLVNNSTRINTMYVDDTGEDFAGAQRFYSRYEVNSTTPCFYNPDNPSDVVLDKSYTAWKWVLFSFPAFFLLVSLIILTQVTTHNAIITTSIWAGLLLPLAFFLPLYTSADIPDEAGRSALFVLMLIFIFFGWFGAVLVTAKKFLDFSFKHAAIVYTIFFGIPFLILLPIYVLAGHNKGVLGAMLGFFFFGLVIFLGKKFVCRSKVIRQQDEEIVDHGHDVCHTRTVMTSEVAPHGMADGCPNRAEGDVVQMIELSTPTIAALPISDPLPPYNPHYPSSETPDTPPPTYEEVQALSKNMNT
eukprot:Colp12_sorted_trinity150504_noHs@649